MKKRILAVLLCLLLAGTLLPVGVFASVSGEVSPKSTVSANEGDSATSSATHTVTYMVRNGEWPDGATTDKTVAIEDGDSIPEPETYERPRKDKWYFGGWFTDAGCTEKYVFNTPVTEDLTLYAGWYVPVFYTSFETPEGSLSDSNMVRFNDKEPWGTAINFAYEGTKVSLEAVPADGYRFAGWVGETDDGKDPDRSFSKENPLTFICSLDAFEGLGFTKKRYEGVGETYCVKALFEKIPYYTVTYKVENGTWSDGKTADRTEKVAGGSSPAEVPAGMKAGDGYTGGAWDTDPGAEIISADTTFTYTFETAYTIRFLNEDGTVLQTSSLGYGAIPSYTGKTPTKAATEQYTYAFAGWDPEIKKVTGDATYRATYTSTPVAAERGMLDVKTGDNNHAGLWAILTAASLLALLLVSRRRKDVNR